MIGELSRALRLMVLASIAATSAGLSAGASTSLSARSMNTPWRPAASDRPWPDLLAVTGRGGPRRGEIKSLETARVTNADGRSSPPPLASDASES